jgi:hypothetical protein
MPSVRNVKSGFGILRFIVIHAAMYDSRGGIRLPPLQAIVAEEM